MSDWTDVIARQNAVKRFVEHLAKPENKEERRRCTADRDYAKGLFAFLGGFDLQKDGYPAEPTKIPKRMEFRVYEENETAPRDEDLGAMILPEKLIGQVDVGKVWRCTWAEWTSFHPIDPGEPENPDPAKEKAS